MVSASRKGGDSRAGRAADKQTSCSHHWMVDREPGADGYCLARCKHCGATSRFAHAILEKEAPDDDNRTHIRLPGSGTASKNHRKRQCLATIGRMLKRREPLEEIAAATQLNEETVNGYIAEIRRMEQLHSRFNMDEYRGHRDRGLNRAQIAQATKAEPELIATVARHARICPLCAQDADGESEPRGE